MIRLVKPLAVIAVFQTWFVLANFLTTIDIALFLAGLMTAASAYMTSKGYGFGILHEILRR